MNGTTKVVTGKVRFSYACVFEPRAMSDADKAKYSICVIIPKSDQATLANIYKAIEVAKIGGKAKLADKNGRIPANLKSPLRDGDDERSDDPAFANSYFLNASSLRQPGVVDAQCNPIMSRDEFYSGCYGRASLNFFAYNTNGNKGIAVGLNNLQKLQDGPRLAGGSTAEEDFGADSNTDADDLM